MPIYNCEKCCFVTENNYDYQRHIKTKKHLKNAGEIKDAKSIQKISNKYPPSIQKVSNKYPISIQKPPDDVIYECEYCDATFKHNNNKYRHQKYRCKAKKTSDDKDLLLQEKDNQIEHLENLLNKALERIGDTTNNNTVNNNNSRNLNITINAYGNEDISYLKNGDWLNMLTNPEDSIVNLFLETHLNPDHPENTNIRIRNRNSKFLEVHDGDNWKNKKKKKMLSEIADDKQSLLDDKFTKDDDLQNMMSERQREAHATFHDEMYYDGKKEIIDNIEGILLDE